MVKTIGGQRTAQRQPDSIRLVRMVRTIGGQTWQLQLAFSTRPDVTPAFVAGRAKGRFQDALRKARCPFSGFSRMLAVRSVGDNTRRQVAKEGFFDPRFREQMEEFTICCPEIDLSQPMGAIRVRSDRLGGG